MRKAFPYIAGYLLAAVTLYAAVGIAQSPTGGALTITNRQTCPDPAPGVFAICKTTVTGAKAQWTDEGSAYANWPPTPGSVDFSQLTGTLSGQQFGTKTCTITLAVGSTSQIATISACQ